MSALAVYSCSSECHVLVSMFSAKSVTISTRPFVIYISSIVLYRPDVLYMTLPDGLRRSCHEAESYMRIWFLGPIAGVRD